MLTFTAPMLLWGVLAAAVPVLVHLLLRARPQRLRFPALPLMRATLASGQRASRVRNLALLLVRAALFAGLAMLLAGPTCASATAIAPQAGPVAAVLVLDDSLSTRYRLRFDDPTTLLDRLRAAMERRVADARTWPPGSRIAVLSAAPASGEAEWVETDAEAVAEVEALVGAPHAAPLGVVLRRAAALLSRADAAQSRLVVFTDLAASAWRDVSPEHFAGLEDLRVEVVGPPAGLPRRNLGLVEARAPDRILPQSAPVPLEVSVRSTGTPASCWLTARRGEDVLARVGPLELAADAQRSVTVELPPQAAGPQAVAVALEPTDLWPFDQEVFVAYETGPRPEAWIVGPDARVLENDLTAVILRNLLAPEALADVRQRLVVRRLATADLDEAVAAAAAGSRPSLLVILSSTPMEPQVVEKLRAFVRGGAAALLVPRAEDGARDWPSWRVLFSPRAPAHEELEARTVIRAERPPGTTIAPAFDELSRAAVWQRVRLEPVAPEAGVVARYGDGTAAILRRPLGGGQVIALTTTPDPRWSELGVRAAGLLTWLHDLAREGAGSATRIAEFTTRDARAVRFAGVPDEGPVAVVREDSPDMERRWVRLRDGVPTDNAWPHAVPGIYGVRGSSGGATAARYVVNWPAAEGDFAPIVAEALAARLGIDVDALTMVDAAGRVTAAARASWHRRARPRDGLAAVVLALFAVETLLAARRSRNGLPRDKKKPRGVM